MSMPNNKISDTTTRTHLYKSPHEPGWVEHEVEQPVDKTPSTYMLESVYYVSQALFWMISAVLIIMDSIETKTSSPLSPEANVWGCIFWNGLYLLVISYGLFAIRNTVIHVRYLYTAFCTFFVLVLLVYLLMVVNLIPLPNNLSVTSKFLKTTMSSNVGKSITKWKSVSFFPYGLSLCRLFEDISGVPMGVFLLALVLNQIFLAILGGVIYTILHRMPKTRWITIYIPETDSYIKDKSYTSEQKHFGSDETITNHHQDWTTSNDSIKMNDMYGKGNTGGYGYGQKPVTEIEPSLRSNNIGYYNNKGTTLRTQPSSRFNPV